MTVERYKTPEIDRIWNREGELERLKLAAYTSAQVTGGDELQSAVMNVSHDPRLFNLELWAELEAKYDHDIAAFVEMVRRGLAPELRERWHRRRTSSDLVETALAHGLRRSGAHLTAAKQQLARALARRAVEYRDLPVMGRTHGQLAEPTTVGRKLALFAHGIDEWFTFEYNLGKVSGPVGTDTFVGDGTVLSWLGLKATPSTQIVPRWYLADWVLDLVPLSMTVSSLATEIRLGSQSGIAWCSEGSPSEDARGSSAMPQKRNPIRSERAVGLCKLIRHNAYAVADASAELWNERDISHSSVERTALVDCIQLLHFVLQDMTGVVDRLVVDEGAASAHTDEPTGVGAVEALIGAGETYAIAYDYVRKYGPRQACEFAGVDGRGSAYDPSTERELWERMENLAG